MSLIMSPKEYILFLIFGILLGILNHYFIVSHILDRFLVPFLLEEDRTMTTTTTTATTTTTNTTDTITTPPPPPTPEDEHPHPHPQQQQELLLQTDQNDPTITSADEHQALLNHHPGRQQRGHRLASYSTNTTITIISTSNRIVSTNSIEDGESNRSRQPQQDDGGDDTNNAPIITTAATTTTATATTAPTQQSPPHPSSSPPPPPPYQQQRDQQQQQQQQQADRHHHHRRDHYDNDNDTLHQIYYEIYIQPIEQYIQSERARTLLWLILAILLNTFFIQLELYIFQDLVTENSKNIVQKLLLLY